MDEAIGTIIAVAVGFLIATICVGAYKDDDFLERFHENWGMTVKLLCTLAALWYLRRNR
jgi:hypothetical protein